MVCEEYLGESFPHTTILDGYIIISIIIVIIVIIIIFIYIYIYILIFIYIYILTQKLAAVGMLKTARGFSGGANVRANMRANGWTNVTRTSERGGKRV